MPEQLRNLNELVNPVARAMRTVRGFDLDHIREALFSHDISIHTRVEHVEPFGFLKRKAKLCVQVAFVLPDGRLSHFGRQVVVARRRTGYDFRMAHVTALYNFLAEQALVSWHLDPAPELGEKKDDRGELLGRQ